MHDGADRLIDAQHPPVGAAGIRIGPHEVRIGALTRYPDLLASPELVRRLPILADVAAPGESFPDSAADRLGGLGLRPGAPGHSTLGDVLAPDRTSAQMSAIWAVLEARCVLRGPRGERMVPVERWCEGRLPGGVDLDEILAEVRIAWRPGTSSAFARNAPADGQHPAAGVAALLRIRGGEIEEARVRLTRPPAAHRRAGWTATVEVGGIEALMHGREPTDDLLAAAGQLAAGQLAADHDLGHPDGAEAAEPTALLTRRVLRTALDRIT